MTQGLNSNLIRRINFFEVKLSDLEAKVDRKLTEISNVNLKLNELEAKIDKKLSEPAKKVERNSDIENKSEDFDIAYHFKTGLKYLGTAFIFVILPIGLKIPIIFGLFAHFCLSD